MCQRVGLWGINPIHTNLRPIPPASHNHSNVGAAFPSSLPLLPGSLSQRIGLFLRTKESRSNGFLCGRPFLGAQQPPHSTAAPVPPPGSAIAPLRGAISFERRGPPRAPPESPGPQPVERAITSSLQFPGGRRVCGSGLDPLFAKGNDKTPLLAAAVGADAHAAGDAIASGRTADRGAIPYP